MAPPNAPATNWLRLALLGGAVAAGLAIAVLWVQPGPDVVPASPPAGTPDLAAPRAVVPGAVAPRGAPSSGTAHAGPAFDVVVVSPDGNAVLAGRAAPGASVAVHDGDRLVGTAEADSRGEWVLLPTEHLPEGGHSLTLTETLADGTRLAGDTPALVAVPAPSDKALAEAVLAPPEGAPVVLRPAGTAPPLVPTLDAIAYATQGGVTFTGRAPARARLRVYVDNTPIGLVQAGRDGTWSLTEATAIPAGRHRLRLDQVAPQGKVIARTELPFERVGAPTAIATGTGGGAAIITVQPGNTLWRIAHDAYGHGPRYVAIFQANQGQIRDPGLIYPGQVIAIP